MSDSARPTEPVPGNFGDLDTLRAWMREQNVSSLGVAFNGFGDEGSVYGVESEPEDAFERSISGRELEEFVCGLASDMLAEFYSGWQDNDGSGGAIEFTPDGARIEFGWRELVAQPDLVVGGPKERAEEVQPGP